MSGLEYIDGRVTGQVADRPLGDVLEVLRKFQPFSYSGDTALLRRHIGASFPGLTVEGAVRRALEGYDYYLFTGPGGSVLDVNITNLSGTAPPTSGKRNAGGRGQSGAGHLAPSERRTAGPGAPAPEVSEAQRAQFEAGMHDPLPPELYDAFYPRTTLGGSQSGPPPRPGMVLEPLPGVDPSLSLDDPPGNGPAPGVFAPGG